MVNEKTRQVVSQDFRHTTLTVIQNYRTTAKSNLPEIPNSQNLSSFLLNKLDIYLSLPLHENH